MWYYPYVDLFSISEEVLQHFRRCCGEQQQLLTVWKKSVRKKLGQTIGLMLNILENKEEELWHSLSNNEIPQGRYFSSRKKVLYKKKYAWDPFQCKSECSESMCASRMDFNYGSCA